MGYESSNPCLGHGPRLYTNEEFNLDGNGCRQISQDEGPLKRERERERRVITDQCINNFINGKLEKRDRKRRLCCRCSFLGLTFREPVSWLIQSLGAPKDFSGEWLLLVGIT